MVPVSCILVSWLTRSDMPAANASCWQAGADLNIIAISAYIEKSAYRWSEATTDWGLGYIPCCRCGARWHSASGWQDPTRGGCLVRALANTQGIHGVRTGRRVSVHDRILPSYEPCAMSA